MANEIQINSTLRYSKSPTSASLATSFFANQTGKYYEAGMQNVGTTEEVLTKIDIGTIGFLAFRNLDATNFVQIGSAAGIYSIKVLPGKGGVMPWNHANVYAKANVAACDVEFLMIEL